MVPVSFLAVYWVFFFPASRDSLYFLVLGHLHFTNPAMTNWINLLLWISSPFFSAFLFCHQLEKVLCSNSSCDFTQQIRIIQDHLPLLKSTDWVLNCIWKKNLTAIPRLVFYWITKRQESWGGISLKFCLTHWTHQRYMSQYQRASKGQNWINLRKSDAIWL